MLDLSLARCPSKCQPGKSLRSDSVFIYYLTPDVKDWCIGCLHWLCNYYDIIKINQANNSKSYDTHSCKYITGQHWKTAK